MKKQAKADWSDLTALDGRSGQEALRILEELKEAQGEQVFLYLGALAPMVMQEGRTCPLSVRVFCVLFELSFQKALDDLLLMLSFMGELRTLLMGINLYALSAADYYRYQDTLWRMENAVEKLLAPKQIKEMAPSDKSALAMLYVSLMCPAPDGVAFLFNRPFEQAFHVRCPHCGNDLHSLYIGLDDANRDKDILEAALPEAAQLGERITAAETYRWLYSYLEAAGETYYRLLLPRLYGQHRCSQCQAVYGVMEGILGYLEEYSLPLPLAGEEEITRNLHFARALMLKGEYERAEYYYQLSRLQQRRVSGAASVKVARIDLQIAALCQLKHEDARQRFLAQRALDTLKALGEQPLDTAQAYLLLASAWPADEAADNHALEEALLYYQQALRLFERELGTDSEQAQAIRQNMAQLFSEKEGGLEKHVQLLEEMIAKQRSSERPDAEMIAHISKELAEVYAQVLADYEQAILYYWDYLDYICAVYTPESNRAADCYWALAALYAENGQGVLAAEYEEQSLIIRIREMGRRYLLPDIFKDMLAGVTQAVEKESNPEGLTPLSLSIAESFDDLGKRHLQNGEPQKALLAFNKALALRLWVIDKPMKEVGDSYLYFAEAWRAFGDEEASRRAYGEAAAIYTQVAEADERDGRPAFLGEARQCRQALDKIADILSKQP